LPAPHQVSEVSGDDAGDAHGCLAGLGIGDEHSSVSEKRAV